MSDPRPPDPEEQRAGRSEDRSAPPRPDVVTVPDFEQGELPSESEPSTPPGAPVHRTPDPAPRDPTPGGPRPGHWRRPPGQEDDMGEPTGSQ